MESKSTSNNNRVPEIKIEPRLNKYSNVVFCPDKVEKARQALENLDCLM